MNDAPRHARVIVLAGPSGTGKSRLAAESGLPVLRLDDFYREHDDPALPRIADGANAGVVDWDHPGSWSTEDATLALTELCGTGSTKAPAYDLATSSRTGTHAVSLDGAAYVVAEGIFAQDLVPGLSDRGLLAAAFCVDQSPALTFWRRLHRDLRERRKPPRVLIARGLALMRGQREFVRRAIELGCTRLPPEVVRARIAELACAQTGQPIDRLWAPRVLDQVGPQPDRLSCGAACLVVARMLAEEKQAEAVLAAGAAATIVATHRQVTGFIGANGRAQAPWWRALGTPPWAIIRELGRRGPRRRLQLTLVGRNRCAVRVRAALDAGHSVPWYVGSRWLPRHIVLVIGHRNGIWQVYEPSQGAVVEAPEAQFVANDLRLAGWRHSWALVLPRVG